jgi:hypothetical protein
LLIAAKITRDFICLSQGVIDSCKNRRNFLLAPGVVDSSMSRADFLLA